jgi:transposase
MNLVELLQIESSEEKAEEFLREKVYLKHLIAILSIMPKTLVKLEETSINTILAVKLFILEVPVHKAHKELDLAYNTTHKIYTKLRQCIYKFVSKDN